MGFIQHREDVDTCLFTHEKWDINIVSHVDDCLVDYSEEAYFKKLTKRLTEGGFDYTESEKVLRVLGLTITENEDSITISQPKYVEEMLQEFDQSKCTERSVPPTEWFKATSENDEEFDNNTFRSAIGCLAYLARMSRPDIEWITFHLATFVSKPCKRHWEAIVQLFGYLKKYPDIGIRFSIPKDGESLWQFYVDADWAGDINTRKSTTGYIIQFMNGPLITKSKRQRITSLSSTESEYCAFTDFLKDIKWIKKVANALKIPFPEPAIIKNDNQTAENLATGIAKLKRTKHIDARYHFIKEAVNLGIVKFLHIPRDDNIADMFTHPLNKTLHEFYRKKVLNEPQAKALLAKSAEVEKSLVSNASFNTIDDKINNYMFQRGYTTGYNNAITSVNNEIRQMFGADREALFKNVPTLRDVYRKQDNIFD